MKTKSFNVEHVIPSVDLRDENNELVTSTTLPALVKIDYDNGLKRVEAVRVNGQWFIAIPKYLDGMAEKLEAKFNNGGFEV